MDLKKNIIYGLVELRGRMSDLKARKYHKAKYQKRVNNDIIRVGFIVHETETWDKCKPVYEEMNQRDVFRTLIIVCPSYDNPNHSGQYGYEWEYFSSNYPDAIKALDDSGRTIDLESLHFDYLFYQDPYIVHYPKKLQPEYTNAYAKLCYIPYGLNLLKQFSDVLTRNRRFFGNMYFGFMDAEYDASLLRNAYAANCAKGLQHFITLGYPALAEYMQYPTDYSVKNIVWTPRWTFDSSLAKSHFLDYKDQMLDIPRKYGCHLTFRPHPLMYSTLIDTGLMSEKEVNAFQQTIDDLGITTDLHSPITDIFKKNGLLITDFSSIIIQFYLTGRPIIYCSCGLEMNEVFQTIIPGIYVADSWEDIDRYLEEIQSGNDYLYPVRQRILSSDVFKRHLNSAAAITQTIEEDWQKCR